MQWFKFPTNFIDDGILKALSGSALKLLVFLLRKTVGFNKDADRISRSQIKESTGLSNGSIKTSVQELVDAGLFTTSSPNRRGTLYTFTHKFQPKAECRLKNRRRVFGKTAEIVDLRNLEQNQVEAQSRENDAFRRLKNRHTIDNRNLNRLEPIDFSIFESLNTADKKKKLEGIILQAPANSDVERVALDLMEVLDFLGEWDSWKLHLKIVRRLRTDDIQAAISRVRSATHEGQIANKAAYYVRTVKEIAAQRNIVLFEVKMPNAKAPAPAKAKIRRAA